MPLEVLPVIVLGPLIEVTIVAVDIYMWLVIISVILSWLVSFNIINTSNRFVYMIVDFLYRITEPALRPIRKFLPNFVGIDIAPVILILALYFLQRVLQNILISLHRAAL